MAASVSKASPSAGSSAMAVHLGWPKGEITDQKVRQLFVSKLKEIAASYEKRSLDKDLKSGGPWYPNQYAIVLKELNQKKRLDFFISKNAFYYGFPPEGFTHLLSTESFGEKEPCGYQLAPHCQPVQGLDNALAGRVSLIDCANAVQLAMYATLREILGDEKFNQTFSGESKSSLCIHSHIEKTPLFTLGLVKEVEGHETPKLGDSVYFSNIPDYVARHPNGDARGYHAVCIGSGQESKEKKYVAFGTPSEGITERQMHDIIIQEFNKDPTDFSSILSGNLAKDLVAQTRELRTHLLVQLKLDVLSMQIDQEGFQRVIDRTKGEGRLSFKAGLAPLFRHFDINGIKALL